MHFRCCLPTSYGRERSLVPKLHGQFLDFALQILYCVDELCDLFVFVLNEHVLTRLVLRGVQLGPHLSQFLELALGNALRILQFSNQLLCTRFLNLATLLVVPLLVWTEYIRQQGREVFRTALSRRLTLQVLGDGLLKQGLVFLLQLQQLLLKHLLHLWHLLCKHFLQFIRLKRTLVRLLWNLHFFLLNRWDYSWRCLRGRSRVVLRTSSHLLQGYAERPLLRSAQCLRGTLLRLWLLLFLLHYTLNINERKYERDFRLRLPDGFKVIG